MNEHLFGSLIGMVILLAIGAVIKNSKDKKAKAKQEKRQEQKRQEEQARIAKELKEAHELEDAKVDIYVNCHKEALKYLKNKDSADWVLENIIDDIIEDLGKESLLTARKNLNVTDYIILGPYTLNRTQFDDWNKEYTKYLTSVKTAKNESDAKKKHKLAKQRQSWQKYLSSFKSLNYAQQENELEWFKKKIVHKIVQNEEQRDRYIHQLEIIHLGKKK